MPPPDRIVLGTAQLGLPYGIANRDGQPNPSTANDILGAAWAQGIRTLDTAQAYGDSENVIGKFLRRHPECQFDVISKLGPDVNISNSGAIENAIAESQRRLGQPLNGLMLHRVDQLTAWDGILGNTLSYLKSNGTIGYLGVSIYHPDDFRRALDVPDMDWIQAPYNVFDQLLARGGLLGEATRRGKTVFLRSVFLQGLLLMTPETLPPLMGFAADALEGWIGLCRRHGLTPQEAALGFALATVPESKIVIGCESVAQVAANMETLGADPPDKKFLAEAKQFIEDPRLIDPSTWPKETR